MPEPSPEVDGHVPAAGIVPPASAGLPLGLHPMIDTVIIVGKLAETQLAWCQVAEWQEYQLHWLSLAVGGLALAVVLLAIALVLK